MAPNKPQTYDLLQNYQLDSPNKFKDLNILPKTNNVTHATGTDLLSQENQDYYNWRDQQYIACKYDVVLEQVTLEFVLNIFLEADKDCFWADNYDQWDNTSNTPMEGDETGGSHTFNIDNSVFNLTNTKPNRKSKTRIVSGVSELNNKSDFYIGDKRQP